MFIFKRESYRYITKIAGDVTLSSLSYSSFIDF